LKRRAAPLPRAPHAPDNAAVNAIRLPANEYRRERWKNGLGWTREILRWPMSGEDWDWRVSIAEVDKDCPFSCFDGVDREIVLLAGEGMHLHFEDGEQADLLPPHGRHRFAGERALRAQLVSGPTQDFNLMWKRGRVEATLLHRPLVGPMLFFAEPGVRWLVTLLGGRALVKDALLPVVLEQGDSLLIDERAEGRVILEGGGELLLARIAPAPAASPGQPG
jgi:environmental stress-induced protein Ves